MKTPANLGIQNIVFKFKLYEYYFKWATNITYQKRSSWFGLVLNHPCFWRDYTQHITNNLLHGVRGVVIFLFFFFCVGFILRLVVFLFLFVLSYLAVTAQSSVLLSWCAVKAQRSAKIVGWSSCHAIVLVCVVIHVVKGLFLFTLVVVFIVCILNTLIVINVAPYCANWSCSGGTEKTERVAQVTVKPYQ